MQRSRRDGLQHPQLVHRHGQIGPCFGLLDPPLQPVPQLFSLVTVAQRFGFGQLLVQLVELCLFRVRQVRPQGLDHLRHAGLVPVVGKAAGVVCVAHRLADARFQHRQLPYCGFVQDGHVCQLRHLDRLLDEPRLHIFALCRPQYHLVQLGQIIPDTPLQFFCLPAIPHPLHPLFSDHLSMGLVFCFVLFHQFLGLFVPDALFFLPFFFLPVILHSPFQHLVLLIDQLLFRKVGSAPFSGHFCTQTIDLRPQFPVFQRDFIQHFLPGIRQPLPLCFPFPLVGFLQHIQLLRHVARIGDVHAQCIQILVQQPFRFCHLLHSIALVSGFLIFPQPPVKFLSLLFLHALQVLHRLGCTFFVSGCCRSGLSLPLLKRIKNSLCVAHLGHVHQLPDDPPRQLHLGVLILRHILKPAHHLRLDGVMHVHQHVQPLGALHAGRTLYARCLCRIPEQSSRAVLHAARGPGIVDDGFILFRRVAIPVSFFLPQFHTVASGFGHCFAPAAILAHKLRFRFAVFVYSIAQIMVFRELLP